MKRAWSVVVVFEDAETRGQAVEVCDHLVQRFWTDCELAVSWWSWDLLEQPAQAQEAIQKAAEADFLIFAVGTGRDFPTPLQEWIETWLSLRGERDGALMSLFGQEAEAGEAVAERHDYLRQVAHRGGMDYLTSEPQDLSFAIPDSLDWYAARAESVTSVLDEILHTQGGPPQMPIENRRPLID
jgi:hypothetical protein